MRSDQAQRDNYKEPSDAFKPEGSDSPALAVAGGADDTPASAFARSLTVETCRQQLARVCALEVHVRAGDTSPPTLRASSSG